MLNFKKQQGCVFISQPPLVYKERHDIEKHFTSSAEVLIIETCQTVIACVYRPPGSSLSVFNADLANALDVISKEGKKILFNG